MAVATGGRIIPLVTLASVAVGLVASAELSAHNRVVLSGWGTATIDGRMAPEEWNGAARAEITLSYREGPRRATVLVMNDGSRAYFALRVFRPVLESGEGVDFHFDNEHDGNNADWGEDILRVARSQGAVDMYFDPATRTIYPDERDGGSNDIEGSVQNDGSVSFFEVAHPINTDDDHDFSLAPGSRAGFSVTLNDCFCPQELVSGWPPGLWADIAIAAGPPPPAPPPGSKPRLGPAVITFPEGFPPRAGSRFSLRIINVRLRGTSTWATPDSYSCAARIARVVLRGRGGRRCAWVIPRTAGGKPLRVAVTIRYRGASRVARATWEIK